MLGVAFVGAFAARLHGLVRDRLGVPCEVMAVDETAIVSRLADLDVLVTLLFNREMARAGRRLKLVQVPAAGLDRIDPAALPPGVWLANAYGHEVGIAEFVIGSILAWNRGLCRADTPPAPGRVGFPVGCGCTAVAATRACREDTRRPRVRADRTGPCVPCPSVRHGHLGDPT